jgi:hypothetical protein
LFALLRRRGGGVFSGQYSNSDNSGVVSALCPLNSTILSANCDCDNVSGTRNYGVLFACQLAGNGGVGGCFPEYGTYDPFLPSSRATITIVCATQSASKSISSASSFSADPATNGILDDELNAALESARGQLQARQQ